MRLTCAAIALFTVIQPAAAQQGSAEAAAPIANLDGRFRALVFRHIGPFRGGRSTAVTGVPTEPFTFYMGSTGGGVYKTTDAGTSWVNVSDGFFEAGSIGAIAAAASDADVVYVGTGSACPRGNVSPGVGMYKSVDAGKTWRHVGLRNAGQIGKLAVHPTNPDIVYAAVLGHVFGPSADRGVYRSLNGGESWENVLFLNDTTGAVDIKMDPADSRVLYAAFWRAERKPWTIISGGPVGGIYKSTDGGETWQELRNGLPRGMTGRIGIAVSPARPQRVWAIIEGERIASGFSKDETGMYRSDDGGASWTHLSADPELHQRPWYYHHLVADPKDADVLYHVGDRLWKSTDGGAKFITIETPHVDQHDLWINPDDPRIMVEANDGGGTVTLNGGATWSTQLNQPTAELYRASIDDGFPYRVYAGQQDYGTISLPSRAYSAGGITLQHWTAIGGGEIGPVSVDPMDADVIYAGGYLSRMDRAKGQIRRIMDYPQYWMGVPSPRLKYRVPSDAPVLASAHRKGVLYTTSQYVHRSVDGGQSFDVISPDLTRDDPVGKVASGGPLTRDITSIETYSTIVTLMESPIGVDALWAGSDDGLVHLSLDAGSTWRDVTPARMPERGRINSIDPSHHAEGRAVIAVNRYLFDDFRPYIFLTDDYGASWKLISEGNGIPPDHFVRVVREDPRRRGLLYAGTEFGIYVSFDDGQRWEPFQQNLPHTPVTDILFKRDDLVVSTQGRGFWILDDVTPLQQRAEAPPADRPWLYRPRATHRIEGGWREPGPYMSQDEFLGGNIETDRVGANPEGGVVIRYTIPGGQVAPDLRLRILDSQGREAHSYSAAAKSMPALPGMNEVVWDLTYPGADVMPESRLDGYTGGPRATPGMYRVRLEYGDVAQEQEFAILADPRSAASNEDLQQQFDFLLGVRDEITRTHAAVRSVFELRASLAGLRRTKAIEAALAELNDIEDHLRQKRSRVWQDTANFEPLLDDQFAWLASYSMSADTRPTRSAHERFADLKAALDAETARIEAVRKSLGVRN